MAINLELLESSWKQIDALGAQVPRVFYAHLFNTAPTVKDLFPVGMAEQRAKLMLVFRQVVRSALNEDGFDQDKHLAKLLALGADHRRFGAEPGHYPVVGAVLLDTLAYLLGGDWTDELAATWGAAYTAVADVMAEGAAKVAKDGVAAWVDAEVAEVTVRMDTSAITVTMDPAPDGYPIWANGGLWVMRVGRPGTWRQATVVEVPVGQATVRVELSDTDPDGWALATIAPGDLLRVAPVY